MSEKIDPKTGKKMIPPLWFALGGLLSCPLFAIISALTAVLCVLIWPIVPFILYYQRKKEWFEATQPEGEG